MAGRYSDTITKSRSRSGNKAGWEKIRLEGMIASLLLALLLLLFCFLGTSLFDRQNEGKSVDDGHGNETHAWIYLHLDYRGEGDYTFQPFEWVYYDRQWDQYASLGGLHEYISNYVTEHSHMVDPEEYTSILLETAINTLNENCILMRDNITINYDTNILQPSYSYSENYQDIWAIDKMSYKRKGVYLDIGVGDGVYNSNSYMLSRRFGWTGLVIEPLLKHITNLHTNRYESTLIPYCVYNETIAKEFMEIDELPKDAELRYLHYDAWTISGIRETLRGEVSASIASKPTFARDHITHSTVQCRHIQSVLDEHGLTYIDYMSINTDGSEVAILHAIDFDKVNIAIIHGTFGGYEGRAAAHNILSPKGYLSIPLAGTLSWYREDLVEIHRNKTYSYSSRKRGVDGTGNVRTKSIYNKEYKRPFVWPRDCPLPS